MHVTGNHQEREQESKKKLRHCRTGARRLQNIRETCGLQYILISVKLFPPKAMSCHHNQKYVLEMLENSFPQRELSLLSTVGDGAFPMAGSRLWNSLPPDVKSAPTLFFFGGEGVAPENLPLFRSFPL